MNDLKKKADFNKVIQMPKILDPRTLEKSTGINFLGNKLLKVTLIGISPFEVSITRQNIGHASVVAQCDCGNYCLFQLKSLVSYNSLPACTTCDAMLDEFINDHYAQTHHLLDRKSAWQKLGYCIDTKVHSLMFWYLLDRSNFQQIRLGPHFKPLSQNQIDQFGIPKYMYLSRICKPASTQIKVIDPSYIYQCLCTAFCQFSLSSLKNFEPLGMCSACTDELRYSFQDNNIHPFFKQLRFKHLWKKLLVKFDYPYVEFRYVWEDYFKARKLVRKQGYELHFSDYIHQYYSSRISPIVKEKGLVV